MGGKLSPPSKLQQPSPAAAALQDKAQTEASHIDTEYLSRPVAGPWLPADVQPAGPVIPLPSSPMLATTPSSAAAVREPISSVTIEHELGEAHFLEVGLSGEEPAHAVKRRHHEPGKQVSFSGRTGNTFDHLLGGEEKEQGDEGAIGVMWTDAASIGGEQLGAGWQPEWSGERGSLASHLRAFDVGSAHAFTVS